MNPIHASNFSDGDRAFLEAERRDLLHHGKVGYWLSDGPDADGWGVLVTFVRPIQVECVYGDTMYLKVTGQATAEYHDMQGNVITIETNEVQVHYSSAGCSECIVAVDVGKAWDVSCFDDSYMGFCITNQGTEAENFVATINVLDHGEAR